LTNTGGKNTGCWLYRTRNELLVLKVNIGIHLISKKMKTFFIMIIGIILSASCFCQTKTIATAIEEKQKIVLSLTERQLKLQKQDQNSMWTESHVMCKALKDSILSALAKDGYRARLGFVLSRIKGGNGTITMKPENQDIFSVTTPDGNSSYIAIVEREDGSEKVSIKMFYDLEEDWQKTFKDVYGFSY